MALVVIEGALYFQRQAAYQFLQRKFIVGGVGERSSALVEVTSQVQDTLARDCQVTTVLGEMQEGNAVLILRQHNGDVTNAKFGYVDHIHVHFSALHGLHLLHHGVAVSDNGETRMRRPRIRVRRHFDQLDDRFVQRKVNQVLYAPANGVRQLVGRDIGHFERLQLVSIGCQDAGRRGALQAHFVSVTRCGIQPLACGVEHA